MKLYLTATCQQKEKEKNILSNSSQAQNMNTFSRELVKHQRMVRSCGWMFLQLQRIASLAIEKIVLNNVTILWSNTILNYVGNYSVNSNFNNWPLEELLWTVNYGIRWNRIWCVYWYVIHIYLYLGRYISAAYIFIFIYGNSFFIMSYTLLYLIIVRYLNTLSRLFKGF